MFFGSVSSGHFLMKKIHLEWRDLRASFTILHSPFPRAACSQHVCLASLVVTQSKVFLGHVIHSQVGGGPMPELL